MRALTLTQPWAGLVASGVKLVENRPRQMIKREDFGKRFAIHASREVDENTYLVIHEAAPELYDYERDGVTMSEWHRLSRITSAVIAVATIDGIVKTGPADLDFCDKNSEAIMALGADQRRWFFGPIGYVLRDVIALPTPVPCRGWQGFWTLERAVADRVEKQIGAQP